MVPQPFDARRADRATPWLVCPSVTNGSYPVAALRAGAIAIVLLGILALLVLF